MDQKMGIGTTAQDTIRHIGPLTGVFFISGGLQTGQMMKYTTNHAHTHINEFPFPSLFILSMACLGGITDVALYSFALFCSVLFCSALFCFGIYTHGTQNQTLRLWI